MSVRTGNPDKFNLSVCFFLLEDCKFHIVLEGTDSSAGYQPMLASKSVEYDRKTVKLQIQVLRRIKYLKHVKK